MSPGKTALSECANAVLIMCACLIVVIWWKKEILPKTKSIHKLSSSYRKREATGFRINSPWDYFFCERSKDRRFYSGVKPYEGHMAYRKTVSRRDAMDKRGRRSRRNKTPKVLVGISRGYHNSPPSTT